MDVKVFSNEEFGQVRSITDTQTNKPWFVAMDVAAALGYAKTRNAVKSHCKYLKLLKGPETGRLTSSPRGIGIIPESDVYRLIMRAQTDRAEQFQDWVTEEVLPSLRETGTYSTNNHNRLEDIQIAIEIAKALRLCNSAMTKMLSDVSRDIAPKIAPHLPAYAIDAPSDASVEGTSYPTQPITKLLEEHGLSMSAYKFNKLAIDAGILEEKERYDSRRKTKKYKAITTEGLRYGKNLSSPANQRETQPHWYSHKFEELLEHMGITCTQ